MANLPDGLELLGLQDKIFSADAAEALFYGTEKLRVCWFRTGIRHGLDSLL